MSYCAFDLETSITLALKRKATPFYNLNTITAIGWKYKGDARNSGVYCGRIGAVDGWLADLLQPGVTFLTGFNIKFDILHAICQGPKNRNAWIDFINRGGQLWDSQLAEYLIHGQIQQAQMLSMNEVAPRYGGHVKNDAIKALWDAGVDTPDIDQDLLMEYLVGEDGGERDLGDIGNTEVMFIGQVNALRARGGMKSALLNMGALVFTIEAEYNGMFVDKDLGLRLAEELVLDIEKAQADLVSYLPEDLPFVFNWNSPAQKSALIFGGTVSYDARVVKRDNAGNMEYFQRDELHYLFNDGSTTSAAPTPETFSEYATFKAGKNAGSFKTKKVKVPDIERGPKTRIEKLEFRFPGYTEGRKEWEGSTPGVYSTSAEVITELGNEDIPFLVALAKFTKLTKDLGTYFIVRDPKTGEEKGMLTLVGPDGIIHHKLNMTNTVTGRLSSSDPNLQNVSKGEFDEETGEGKGSQIKRCFVSRFIGQGKIIQSDFTALEIYVQANLSLCRRLIEDLRAGRDMHCVRAHQAWGSDKYTYEFILDAATNDKHPDHRVWKKKRGNAKVFSFQRAYGAGAAKISKSTKMPLEDVEQLIAAEEREYPELKQFTDAVMRSCEDTRVPTSTYVNHPRMPGVVCQLGRGYYTTPDGKLYSFTESPAPDFIVKRGGPAQNFSPTETKNYPVQGTGGEWAKAAMWLAVRAFYKKRNFDGLALLVNQVHDAVYVDARDDVAVEAAALLQACMDEASALMEKHFGWDLQIKVPAVTKMGNNMMEEHDPPDMIFFAERVDGFRTWVRGEFLNGYIPDYQ